MPKNYITIQGDTWDIIAFKNYSRLGREKLMSELINANSKYADYVIFPAGINLILPDIEIPVVNTLPPWLR